MIDTFDSKPEYKSFIKLVADAHKIVWSEGYRHPVCLLRISATHRDDLHVLMDQNWITEIVVDGSDIGTNADGIDKILGKLVKLTFQLPVPNEDVSIVKDLDSLLKYSGFLMNTPRSVYFIENKSHVIPSEYLDTVSFANTLKRTADHFDDKNDEYVCYFYNSGRVVVPIKYLAGETRSLPGIHDLQKFFSDGPNLNEKIKIFKSSIVKISMTCPSESISFVHLLDNFQALKNTYDQDWNFYLSEFSFDDILDELEEKILKIADKISSSLSDLQRTMITIPLAIIFAAPKLETGQNMSATNMLIVVSIWVFSGFTTAFLHNHKNALNFIVVEIEDQKKIADEKHKMLAKKIKPKLDRLITNCSSQTTYRRAIVVLLWSSVIVITSLIFFPQRLGLITPPKVVNSSGCAVNPPLETILPSCPHQPPAKTR